MLFTGVSMKRRVRNYIIYACLVTLAIVLLNNVFPTKCVGATSGLIFSQITCRRFFLQKEDTAAIVRSGQCLDESNKNRISNNRTNLEKAFRSQIADTMAHLNNWRFNKTRLDEVKNNFLDALPERAIFHVDKLASEAVSPEFIKNEPPQRKSTLYRRCSIIGNGGILKESGCGEEIDKADLVIRANFPYVRNIQHDVGMKMNITTFNPSIFQERFSGNISIFREVLAVNYFQGYIVFPTPPNPVLMEELRKNTEMGVMMLDGEFKFSMRSFLGGKQLLSTGPVMVGIGFTLCEEIHLFGFWPFPFDPKGNDLPIHYTAYAGPSFNLEQLSCYHDMPWEYKQLVQWHMKGLIKLHVGKCP